MEGSNKNSIHQSQSTLDRLVRLNSSSANRGNTTRPYSPWNKPNINGFRHWGSSVDRSSFRLKVHNGQDNKLKSDEWQDILDTHGLSYCINCGCEPKPDQWAGHDSRFCIDCGDIA